MAAACLASVSISMYHKKYKGTEYSGHRLISAAEAGKWTGKLITAANAAAL